METFIFTVVVFLICAAGMGIGMLLNRRSKCMQQGTCGGTPIEVDGEMLTCSTCPNRDKPGYRAGGSNCSGAPSQTEHSVGS